MKTFLIFLDYESAVRNDLYKYLTNEGYEVYPVQSIEEANTIIQTRKIDFAIIDLKIDYTSEYGGFKVIENINKLQPQTKIIVLSGYERNDEIKNQLEKVVISGYISKGGEGNYIREVIKVLQKIKADRPPKKCFVIMPFSTTKSCTKDEWNDIFKNTIKIAVEKSGLNYECSRAELVIGNIFKDILENLNRADLVIADMTDRNPNVFYELGVRHALRHATILITQNIDDIPFDLQHFATIEYDWKTVDGKKDFKKKIKEALFKIEGDPNNTNFMSPVREYLKLKTSNDS